MSASNKPMKPDDFPVNAEGQKIKKQDGQPIANTEDPDVAAGVQRIPVAERTAAPNPSWVPACQSNWVPAQSHPGRRSAGEP